MILKDIFKKDINRNIETVIKADDRDNISDELTEYVITKEISKKISEFFRAYNNYQGVNGVWISGFFGSGKSHLLKIISYVLENKTYNSYNSGVIFAEKVEDDAMLKADILASTRIPSESILFNIDQQSQITSKSDENAILSVFYKVFYDHLGYYGSQTHIAEFEMWLDNEEKYSIFKENFATKYGKKWENSRLNYFDPKVTDSIAEVLGEINNGDAKKYNNILDEIEERQKKSIEDFVSKVNQYIKTKEKAFRLNFFVDEVGQYISNNTKLMLNLQTIAETLATKTKGGSWILVTSQEDMEKVVGDMDKQQQNDFSRIQARFDIKIPLTSANVDEVIEKRLLKKNDDAQSQLEKIYTKEEARLKTLLSFSESGVQFTHFKNSTEFANQYPFASYQFDLFQQCRRNLSVHNAFQGKHASVGERSMLGVFQQVVNEIKEKNENTLVSFDLMFEGIRKELRGEIQSSISLAEKNLADNFAIKVLKALFLTKYYNSFKTTIQNINILMINEIDFDIDKHKTKVKEALNLLENQSYIQRNGDIYEFLTDDEKDVEYEIKETEVDEQAVTNFLKEIFFDEIIRDNKIQFRENKQNYEFVAKIDGALIGREKELIIEIITDNYGSGYEQVESLKSQTMGTSLMRLRLPSNLIFIKDIKMYLKTKKYVQQKNSTSNSNERKRILHDKAAQNNERKRNIKIIANELLAYSDVFINGINQELNATSEGKTKVFNAFQILVKSVYPNLTMLGNINFSEDSIKNIILNKDYVLFDNDKEISEAEREITMIIDRRKKQSDRSSLLDIKNTLIKKPYGWYPNAIWSLIAKSYKRGKIEIRTDSNLIENSEVLNVLLNSAKHGNTHIELQSAIDPKQVNKLRNLYSEAFDESCSLNEAKDLALAFKDKIKDMLIDVNQLIVQQKQYLFLNNLEEFTENLTVWSNKEYKFYLENIDSFENDLLDAKEDLLDPIKQFMNGAHKNIYDSIKKLVESNTGNIAYVDGDEFNTLKTLIDSRTPYKGNAIQIAKATKDTLTKKIIDAIETEKKKAIEIIESKINNLKSKTEYNSLNTNKQAIVITPIQDELNKLKDEKIIARIRDIANDVNSNLHQKQLNEMIRLATPAETNTEGVVYEPIVHYISKAIVKPKYDKSELKTENDVDEYIEALRIAYKEQIKNNKRISL